MSKKYRDQLSCSEKKPDNWFITGKSTGLYTHWGFIGHLGGHSLYIYMYLIQGWSYSVAIGFTAKPTCDWIVHI